MQSDVVFKAKRGPLKISVTEGGNIEALNSQEIRSEIEGSTKILSIVPEGYRVTQEDVENGKILVELDSSNLKDEITSQQIQLQSTMASLIDAQQSYEIQVNQNKSDIKAAEQAVRFARMDLEEFLGVEVTKDILADANLQETTVSNLISMAEDALGDLDVSNTTNNGTTESQRMERQPPTGAEGRRPEGGSPPNAQARQDGAPAAGGRSGAGATEGSEREQGARASAQQQPQQQSDEAMRPADGPPSDGQAPGEMPVPPEGMEGMPSPMQAAGGAPQPQTQEVTFSTSIPKGDIVKMMPGSASLIDFTKYADESLLGEGSARQQLRQLEDSLLLAQQELGQAKTHLEGTQRLFDKGFVTQNELDNEELTVEKNKVSVNKAQTDLNLYIKYTFTKTAEEYLSTYEEALNQLERTVKEALAKLAQSSAQLRSAESRYRIELEEYNEFVEQYENCVIRAEVPGLVVYGDPEDRGRRWGNDDPIREGTEVRERQTILTIPEMSKMSASLKIHESYIKKITPGLKAKIKLDAYPDEVLDGTVTKVGVLPDSQDRWLNPDMRVYNTTVTIDGSREWVKPGMSANVEIIINELTNVVYIPLQAVSTVGNKHVCYVTHSADYEMREIEIGQFNDEFIAVKDGLEEGEKVLLRPPDDASQSTSDEIEQTQVTTPMETSGAQQ